MAIRFNKHHVTDGTVKARVFYSLDNRTDGRACVTLYAKDYSEALAKLFAGGEYVNHTDSQSDYFDQGHVSLFADHALYASARERAELNAAENAERRAEREARERARRAA